MTMPLATTITAMRHDHTPHESPLVMLVPLDVLAAGALLAGLRLPRASSSAEQLDAFWQGALRRADNHVLEDDAPRPPLVGVAGRRS